MTKQMLIYERARPVALPRHQDFSVELTKNYRFINDTNAVPIVVGEFSKVALEYPIVFTKSGEKLQAVALLGFRDNENLFVLKDGAWDASYVPAFVRRYPFVFHHKNESDDFMLCVDEAYPGVNAEGRGRRLFESDGKQSDFLKSALNFTSNYQVEAMKSQAFGDRLLELDILGQAQISFRLNDGAAASTRGMLAVDKERLAQLPPDKLSELMGFGDLELIYAHLISLANIDRLGERLRRVDQEASD